MTEITDILDVEKYISDADAVIFDLDDTLYSEKEYVKSGFNAVAGHFKSIVLADELWDVFEKHGKPIDEVLERHGLTDRKEEALRIYRFHKPCIHLYFGVWEMLYRIKQTKKLGIITDGRPEGQRAKLEALHLTDFVDNIIITDELGGESFRKPNAAAFRLMRKKMNVPFNRMVYIGDNLKKDCTAPRLLGMKFLHFMNEEGLYR